MVATSSLTLYVLPFEPDTTQVRLVRLQPSGSAQSSLAVQVPGGTLNVWLLGSVGSLSSSSEKFWLIVLSLFRSKLKSWASSGTASFTMTIVPLGITVTTLACIWLSRWPTDAPSTWSSATWYGEPLMLPAPSPRPQLACAATWAPNHSTTPQVVTPCFVAHIGPVFGPTVKVTVITVSLSPA